MYLLLWCLLIFIIVILSFQHRRCSSSHNSLRGITHHPVHILLRSSVNSVNSFNSYSAVLPPSPMVFFKWECLKSRQTNTCLSCTCILYTSKEGNGYVIIFSNRYLDIINESKRHSRLDMTLCSPRWGLWSCQETCVCPNWPHPAAGGEASTGNILNHNIFLPNALHLLSCRNNKY